MSDIPIFPVLESYGWDDLPPERESWRTIRCHFHEDRHGSARVTANEGGFLTCMGCGWRGDAIDVVRHYESGLSFSEARRRAEQISGHVSDDRGTQGVGGRAQGGSTSRKRKYTPPRQRVR